MEEGFFILQQKKQEISIFVVKISTNILQKSGNF